MFYCGDQINELLKYCTATHSTDSCVLIIVQLLCHNHINESCKSVAKTVEYCYSTTLCLLERLVTCPNIVGFIATGYGSVNIKTVTVTRIKDVVKYSGIVKLPMRVTY